MGVFKIIVAVTAAGLLWTSNVWASGERFWSVVTDVLAAHRVDDADSFQKEFYNVTALGRIRRFEEDFPSWTTVRAGVLRKGRPQSKTIRQLYLMFSPEEGRRLLETAQVERREEFGFDPEVPPEGQLFQFIEREEIAGTLGFRPRRKLFEGMDSWSVAANTAQKLLGLTGPLMEPGLNLSIDRVLNWIDKQPLVSEASKMQITAILRSWKYVEPPEVADGKTRILDLIAQKLATHLPEPDFDPQRVPITPLQLKVLAALIRLPLTGPEMRQRLRGPQDTPMDSGLFSKTMRALVTKRLVFEVSGAFPSTNIVKMYALTPEGWDVLDHFERRGQDCAPIVSAPGSKLRNKA